MKFFNGSTETPMVFAWVPVVAIYFLDPDGHYLEFIATPEGEGKPELGIITFADWTRLTQQQP